MGLLWLTIPQPTVKQIAKSIGYEPAWSVCIDSNHYIINYKVRTNTLLKLKTSIMLSEASNDYHCRKFKVC